MDWTDRRERLRATVASGRCIHPGSVHDPISARIAEDLGFEAGMLAGSVASLAVLGAPDIVVLTLAELADQAYDRDYLAARNVRIRLQGHAPFNAAVNAIHATLKALRDGKPSWELPNISPPSDLLKQATRAADYAAWTRDFLDANPKG